jgi:nucleotide-binding universal stress UspA family protein
MRQVIDTRVIDTRGRAGTREPSSGARSEARDGRPIVAAVDGSPGSRAASGEAVRLAAALDAPLVFVYVRRGPAGYFGEPVYQQRLSKELARARRALEPALAAAADEGVDATAEVLEGSPRRRIADFARDRQARLVVVGSRRRKLTPSVSRGVVQRAGRPVVVARAPQALAAAS